MATVPKVVPLIHEVENVLAFDQQKTIKAGQPAEIFGTLDTSRFDKVRVVVANESVCSLHVWLKILEPEGNRVEEKFNLDEFTLQPNNQLTRVYDVPATKLEVSAMAVGKAGTNAEVEVLIYGQY